MSRAVTHLFPSMNPVTIRTKQAQIAFVGSPVFEAIIPSLRAPSLFAAVNVVNVQDPIIAFAALNADTAKLPYKCQLSAPVSGVFMDCMAVFIPMVNAAFFRTKSMLAIDPAALASRLPFPARRQIAGLAAILSSPVFKAIKMHFKLLLAIAASHCDRSLFHYQNILYRNVKVKFDIACKRIEDAQRQGDLFIEGAAA